MPTAAPSAGPVLDPFFSDGLPVEIPKIDKSLKKLWQLADQTATRASRLNLVTISMAEHSLQANTALMGRVTAQHACRCLLIAARPQGGEARLRAWVNAHCHVVKAGAKQLCSEQIAFLFEGEAATPGNVASAIFSHLDTDLPLYLWWQGDLPADLNPRLLRATDRVIYDSAGWDHPAAQFARLRDMLGAPGVRAVPGDLNWVRATWLRLAVAQLFDPPAARAALASVDRLEVTHAQTGYVTALLVVGWLASSLGWEPPVFENDGSMTCARADGGTVQISLPEGSGPTIQSVELSTADGARFSVERRGGDFYFARSETSAGASEQSVPADPEDLAELVIEELSRGGQRLTYARSLEKLASLARQSA